MQERSDVAGIVIGREGEPVQFRLLAIRKRTAKVVQFLSRFRSLYLCTLDAFLQLLLKRSQDLVALSCLLPVLLKIVQPKRRGDTDENEQEFGRPATNLRVVRENS